MDYMDSLNRRRFMIRTSSTAILMGRLDLPAASATSSVDPWSPAELMRPGELAELMKHTDQQPRIICVTFPALYRQRHIAGAILAGPGSKPEGLASLHSALAEVDKPALVVLYCGCCPMTECPNIRPAYIAVKKDGFSNARVLSLPTNLHTDWVVKGYPVES
jgi:thiosulfate/3-mercaptopyruvate sulfurtransferase